MAQGFATRRGQYLPRTSVRYINFQLTRILKSPKWHLKLCSESHLPQDFHNLEAFSQQVTYTQLLWRLAMKPLKRSY